MRSANLMEVAAYLGYLAAAGATLAFWPKPDDPWNRVDTLTLAAVITVAASVLWVGSKIVDRES